MSTQPDNGHDDAAAAAGPRRTLTLATANLDDNWDIDEKLAVLWRSARLGPTVERLRRHVLQGGERSIEAGQFRALDTVAAHGPCPVRELAVTMGLEPSSVTRALARLEDKGLIAKRRSTQDQREVLVELTSEGLDLHQYFVGRAFEIYQEIFAVFSHDERLQLTELLERMLKATEQTLASSSPTSLEAKG